MCRVDNDNKKANGTALVSADDDDKVPRILHLWCAAQKAVPKVFEVGGLDLSFALLSAVALSLVRYLAEYIMVMGWNWPAGTFETKATASSVGSLVHSSCLVPSITVWFWTVRDGYRPSASLSDSSAAYQQAATALLQFCTGYMIYDSVINHLWCRWSMGVGWDADTFKYVFHHVACCLYILSARFVRAGHQAALICIVVGELTNPLQNAYHFNQAALEQDCCNGETSQALFAKLEFYFGLAYVLVRGVVTPPAALHLTYSLFQTRNKRIPTWLLICWTTILWILQLGTIPYMIKCWNMSLGRILFSSSSASAANDEL